MRLFLDLGDRKQTVAVRIEHDGATVADLATSIGLPSDAELAVDGQPVSPSDPLRTLPLVEGSRISAPDHQPSQRRAGPPTGLHLNVVAGVDAGATHGLPVGRARVGRTAVNDIVINNPTISARHAIVDTRIAADGQGHEVLVEDAGSHNGTWIGDHSIHEPTAVEPGDRLRVGSSVVAVREHRIDDRPLASGPAQADQRGRILVNRPPRSQAAPPASVVEVPAAPPERRNPALSVIALVVPVVFSIVMVQVTGRWQYGLFALLSPAMLLGNHLSNRRRVRRDRRDDARRHSELSSTFRRNLERAAEAERIRRAEIAPDLAEVRRRCETPSTRLWERRHGADDAMTVGLGRGAIVWEPPLSMPPHGEPDPEALALIDDSRRLEDVELLVDLRAGPVGLFGEAAHRRASARSLVLQLAAHHGPADISIAVLTTPSALFDWEWAEWLPHCFAEAGSVRVLTGAAASSFSSALLDDLDGDETSRGIGDRTGDNVLSPGCLLVVDDIELLHGRSSPTRRLLSRASQRIHGIVLTDSEDQLPASTSAVGRIGDDGSILLRKIADGAPPAEGVADLPSTETAVAIARALARYEDPDRVSVGGGLPDLVRPGDIWGALDASSISEAWAASKASAAGRPAAVMGMAIDGPLVVDLVHDGPHGLVAGTTGAGKSEFLRTLITGLAQRLGPDDLNFVLIDYKGGSAFDRCTALPHVVGMTTDLDAHLSQRALRSLEAELRRRELAFREAAVSDLVEYRAVGSDLEPLPRLVVVIDEFATLRSELPDFVTSLVGVAQRGRSLGVHLILATQRPSGAVDANIRANTNLRVALRVQDAADSIDVIESKAAASLPRSVPGRAYVRRGEGDLVLAQTAFVSGPVVSDDRPPVVAAPVPLGSGQPPDFGPHGSASDDGLSPPDPTELARMVAAIVDAAEGMEPARRPWLEDLPTTFVPEEIEDLDAGDGATVPLAVGDDPDNQRRVTLGWSPTEGHLGVYGVLGAGVTTTLRSLVHRLAAGVDDRPAWVFACDHGAAGLAGVASLDHVSCRLDPNETARHRRLVRLVADVVEERRALPAAAVKDEPLVVVVIDGLAGFTEVTDSGSAGAGAPLWERIVRDGPAVGVVIAFGATGPSEVPRTLASAVRKYVVLQLADSSEYAALGVNHRHLPEFRPGRAFVGDPPLVCQVLDWWSDELSTARLARPDHQMATPPPVDVLAEYVPLDSVQGAVEIVPNLCIPLGTYDDTREPAMLMLRPGEHALVAGPSGSGRTTALLTIARQLRNADPDLVLVAVAPTPAAELFDRSLFDAAGTTDALESVLEVARSDGRRWVILVDDADRIDGEDGSLVAIARSAPAGVNIIASGRSAPVRTGYGHWLRSVRSSGIGLILGPDNGVDGELLATRLPRDERLPSVPGRGYLVTAGEARAIQVAT